MCLIVYLTFFSFRLKKFKKKQNYFLVYSILFFIFTRMVSKSPHHLDMADTSYLDCL